MLSASCTVASSSDDDFFVDSIEIGHDNEEKHTHHTTRTITSAGSGCGSISCCCCSCGRKTKKVMLILTIVLCLVAIPTVLYFVVLDGRFGGGNASKLQNPDGDGTNIDDGSDNEKPIIVITQEERQLYYNQLMYVLPAKTFPIETGSPNARALEWMAFVDNDVDLIQKTLLHQDDEKYYIEQRVSQRYALLVFYFALGGPQLWNVINQDPTAGWIEYGSEVHECSWKGIDCTTDESIIGLRLSGGFGITLTGTSLPSELELLTHLEVLNLQNNRLQGTIPNKWKALTNLVIMNLGNNILDSVIPSWIGDMSQLQALNLAANSFSGSLPKELWNLELLERLDVQGNPTLHGSITEILVSLPNLVYLDVSSTGVTGSLPTNNNTLPPPPNSHLHVLRAFPAAITGTIPTEMGIWWKNLNELEIGASTTSLTGSIPTEVGILTNLSVLRFRRNDALTGTLPSELGLLRDLKILDLAQTNRHGTLPKEYSNLTNLKEFDVYENPISGTIPEEYGALTNLRYGWFQHTDLSGTVPSSLCDLNAILEADCLVPADAADSFVPDDEATASPRIECDCCTCYRS